MQAKPRIFRILLVALIASLLLGACYGGSTGRTWFNLPSLPVRVQQDGSAMVYGFNLGPVLQPAMVEGFQSGNLQKIELRIGYNGVHVETNGEDMPYLSWDEEQTTNLGAVLASLPGVPNGSQIAQYLPWLRKVGVGAILWIPPASGGSELSLERWSGETTVQEETPAETTIGPMQIGMIAFDEQGNGTVEGIPLPQLQGALSPEILVMLNALGVETLEISTHPNGIDISMNGQPLPGIAYDTARLTTLMTYAPALGVDAATMATLEQVVPALPGADVQAVVSFTGEPAMETDLGQISLDVGEDGSLSVFGIPLGAAAMLDDETLGSLQDANIQRLDVEIDESGLYLGANGERLPTLSWDDASIETLAGAVAPLAGMTPEELTGLLGIARGTGVSTVVNVPPGSDQGELVMPAEVDYTMTPAELERVEAPSIQLRAGIDEEGNVVSIGKLDTRLLSLLGADLAIPADAAAALNDLGAESINITNGDNQLNLALDGANALTVNYDEESLGRAIDLAGAFTGESPLSDPAVNLLLENVVLPLAPATDIDITLDIE